MKSRTPIESDHAFDHWLRVEADKAIAEARRGVEKHGPLMSMHEGYAVLLEEVDELWHELKSDNRREGPGDTYMECIQIAAVALRLSVVAHKRQMEAD